MDTNTTTATKQVLEPSLNLVTGALNTGQFIKASFDPLFRPTEGYVLYTDPVTRHLTIRYEPGPKAQGKRVKELLPKVEAQIKEYQEYLEGCQYLTLPARDPEDLFPVLHIVGFYGKLPEPVVDPNHSFNRQTYQQERYAGQRASKRASLGYSPNGDPPNKIRVGGTDVEVGHSYILVGGSQKYKGKVVMILALEPLSNKADVRLPNGTTFKVRLSSLGPEARVKKAPPQPTSSPSASVASVQKSPSSPTPALPTALAQPVEPVEPVQPIVPADKVAAVSKLFALKK